MRDREPTEYTETQLVLIPVLVEAVGAIVFIGCAILLVVVLAMPPVPA